jgi:hypothetical protein
LEVGGLFVTLGGQGRGFIVTSGEGGFIIILGRGFTFIITLISGDDDEDEEDNEDEEELESSRYNSKIKAGNKKTINFFFKKTINFRIYADCTVATEIYNALKL